VSACFTAGFVFVSLAANVAGADRAMNPNAMIENNAIFPKILLNISIDLLFDLLAKIASTVAGYRNENEQKINFGR
jgi:hypothetical protein